MHTQVEGGLTTKRQENTIWTLFFYDVGDVLCGDREVVDGVGESVRGLNGSDVGVDKDRGDAGFLESL